MSLAGLLHQHPDLTDYFNTGGQDIYLSTSLGNYVDGIDTVPLQISSTLLPSVDGSDMISELPDSILCHILSFLPTVYAIRTSCLSKRWRFIWTSVASLDFQDMYYASQHIKYYSDFIFIRCFVKFVNEVFTRHTNPCIRRFSLQLMCPYSTVVVDSWISAAITHNVEELTLFMRNACFLPQIFFSSKTLVTVKFHSGINFEVPESVSLPSLKTLHLQKIPCLTDARIECILSGCPVLEDLVIDRIKDDDIESLSISSSSLKSFKLINNRGNEEDYDVVIDAPQLKFLYLRDDCAANYSQVKNFSSVVNATFECIHGCQVLALSYEEEMVQIMQKRNVEYCTMISRTLLKTLVGTSNNKLLSCDNKLTKLVMRCCGADLKVFPDILKFLPNLEVLVLDFYKDCSLTIQFEVLEEETTEISCLKCSLKKVELRSFKGMGTEMQAVEYFLKNARVLTEIRLRTEKGSEVEAEVLKKLLMFTRCSDTCQIVVS